MTCQPLHGVIALLLTMTPTNAIDEPHDPYKWLEDVTGARPLTWVKERNSESIGELAQSTAFQALERRLLEILDSDARIPTVQKIGPLKPPDLERIAGVLFLSQNRNGDVNERARRLHERTPHVPLHEAQEAVTQLDQLVQETGAVLKG